MFVYHLINTRTTAESICFVPIAPDLLDHMINKSLRSVIHLVLHQGKSPETYSVMPVPKKLPYHTVFTRHEYIDSTPYFLDQKLIAITDGAGNIIERVKYGIFGRATLQDSEGNDIIDVAKLEPRSFSDISPYLYHGRRYDEETGLYYFRNRYYSPSLGRFISFDPMGYIDGMNLYEFVNGNPVNLVDPWGFLSYSLKSYITGFAEGFIEGAGEGVIITLDVFTPNSTSFGTEMHDIASSYKGLQYDISRFGATGARESLITAGTAGLSKLAATSRLARLGYIGLLGAEAFSGGYQLGRGINKLKEGCVREGINDILSGSLRVGGAIANARAFDKLPKVGDKVYRVFGENNKPMGEYWTPVNPNKLKNFRSRAGLPNENTGRFVLEGEIIDNTGIKVGKATSLDGNLSLIHI